MTVFTTSPGGRARWGTLGLGFPFFLFTWALVLRFHRYPLSFSILFISDGWLRYPNHVFASWMFLQIKDM